LVGLWILLAMADIPAVQECTYLLSLLPVWGQG
jgi:hypothetical protein